MNHFQMLVVLFRRRRRNNRGLDGARFHLLAEFLACQITDENSAVAVTTCDEIHLGMLLAWG